MMTNKETNIIDFKDIENSNNLSLFIDIIHEFSQNIAAAKSEKYIFNILADDLAKKVSFVDCVVYRVDNDKQLLKQVAAFGESKVTKDQINNPLELKFGQGHAGIAAENGQTLLIPDVTKSDNYLFDLVQAGSEMVVPVKIHNKVYAVISSEHPSKNFYKEEHKKLWEVIASIAAGELAKLQKKTELDQVKVRLESVIERKSADLDKAIETLSAQYSEMKYYHEKQETLIQEVHHRVTNNLQIISSILRLYINEGSAPSLNAFQEVYNRIQVMALIHQNIYKSMEMNLVNISSYLKDLLSYLKSTPRDITTHIDSNVEVEHFSLDVLVPFGLFISEVFYFWIENSEKKGLNEIDFSIELSNSIEKYSYELLIKDRAKVAILEDVDIHTSEGINCILISALTDQLEGSITQGYNDGNFIKLKFKALI